MDVRELDNIIIAGALYESRGGLHSPPDRVDEHNEIGISHAVFNYAPPLKPSDKVEIGVAIYFKVKCERLQQYPSEVALRERCGW